MVIKRAHERPDSFEDYEKGSEEEGSGEQGFGESWSREGLSWVKLKSFYELQAGTRAYDFTLLLKKFPSFKELQEKINTQKDASVQNIDIKNAFIDLDGTLVSPYNTITSTVLENLKTYTDAGIRVFIDTNSPYSHRLDILKENPITEDKIKVLEKNHAKPNLIGFTQACEEQSVEPDETIMIGNFAVTDMPLVLRGEKPFFPIHVLIESIPLNIKNMELDGMSGLQKLTKITKAYLFHQVNLIAADIVQQKQGKKFS